MALKEKKSEVLLAEYKTCGPLSVLPPEDRFKLRRMGEVFAKGIAGMCEELNTKHKIITY